MSNQPPIEVPQGAIRLNTDSQRLEFFAQDRWYEMATNTPVLNGGARGLSIGGNNPGFTNTIEFITIATSGNSTNFGSLTVARKYSDSSCSTTRGLIAGGTDGSNRTNVIDFITIASQGDATDFGDLTIVSDTGKSGVVSNSIRGLFAGFYPTASRIEFVTIASAGNAADFGDCTYVATSANGCADSHGGIGE